MERRRKEFEEQKKVEAELSRRRKEEERRRKEQESRRQQEEQERLAAVRRSIATCLKAANDYLEAEQFDKAAEEIQRAYKLEPGNEDIQLMANRLRLAQERFRLREEADARREEEERLRREAEEARRRAEDEATRMAQEEERRRKEELERREAQLKKIAEYLEKGELYLHEGNIDKAKNELSRIYILDSNNAAARIFEGKIKDYETQLARVREEQELQRKTEEEERRRKIERENQIQLLLGRAEERLRKLQYDEALDEVVRVFAIDPSNEAAHQLEEKIRSSQEISRKAEESLAPFTSNRKKDSSLLEVPEKVEEEIPEAKHAKKSRQTYYIMIAGAIIVGSILVFAGLRFLYQTIFPERKVIVIQPFVFENKTDTLDIGKGLAVLINHDLESLHDVGIIDDETILHHQLSTSEAYRQSMKATHIISGRISRIGTQLAIVVQLADSVRTINTWRFAVEMENLDVFRHDLTAKIADAAGLDSTLLGGVTPITTSLRSLQFMLRGLSLLLSDRRMSAINYFANSITADEKNIEARYWLASALLDSCEVLGSSLNESGDRALEELKEILLTSQNWANANALMAVYSRLRSQFHEQQVFAKRALEKSPSNTTALGELAINESIHNNPSKSKELAVLAVTLNPESFRAWLILGLQYHLQGKYSQAINAYQRAIILNPESVSEIWNLLLFDAQDRAGSGEAVSMALKKMLDKDPKNYDILYRLGRTTQGLGRRIEANQILEKAKNESENAILRDQSDWSAHITHGLALMRLGRFADGLSEIRKLSESNPDNVTILYTLAKAYAIYHKEDEAAQALTKAIDKDYRIILILDLDFFYLRSNEQYQNVFFLQDNEPD